MDETSQAAPLRISFDENRVMHFVKGECRAIVTLMMYSYLTTARMSSRVQRLCDLVEEELVFDFEGFRRIDLSHLEKQIIKREITSRLTEEIYLREANLADYFAVYSPKIRKQQCKVHWKKEGF